MSTHPVNLPTENISPKRAHRNNVMLAILQDTTLEKSLTSFLLVFFFFSLTADPTQGLSEGAIAGIVIGSVAGVALIAALIYFLYSRKTGG